MHIPSAKHVHCVGIGGIGISAVAKFFLAHGMAVTGSDLKESAITKELEARGVRVHIGPSQSAWIADDCDLLIYSEAVPADAPERLEAARRSIRQLGHFDFLGDLSQDFETICVTGTNGKSTTTAMVARIFEDAGLDPMAFVGSLVPGWKDGNYRHGKGKYLIVEGDEYKQKMVKLFPKTTVITNIEEDHLDVYRDLDHIIATFQECVNKTAKHVFRNSDDPNSMRLEVSPVKDATYGHSQLADIAAKDRIVAAGEQSFTIERSAKNLGRVSLKVPGEFNMMNAVAALCVASQYDIAFAQASKTLGSFSGIWRRFERVGEHDGADIISDYGHHPTAIRGTLAAAKEFFPGRRVVLIFEPHQHSRTHELFDDFVESFDDADVLILSEIYGVAGRKDDAGKVSSRDILEAIDRRLPAGHEAVGKQHYAADLTEAERILRALIRPNDVVIVMGAGDVDVVARNLVA
jgi:UDP-N-acetylmuramate--alanine ligase